jgi:DNA-directed RNA polymerase subunit RPC12/RpoP
MPSKYAAGKKSIAECDRCGFRYLLKELKTLTIKTKNVKIKVCKTCWEPDQPQLSLGMYPVNDPQAVREPRPDVSYIQSGYTGIQTKFQTGPAEDETGYPSGGSRIIQWGWYPVGGSRANDAGLTPNNLAVPGVVNSVTVLTT